MARGITFLGSRTIKSYLKFIEDTEIITEIDSTLTTGDMEYPGTALEIDRTDARELFHVVVDGKGQQQVLFFAHELDYRIPLDLLSEIISWAKEKVHAIELE